MDLATVIGSVAGTLVVMAVMMVSGSLLMYWDLLSIVIVIGGAACSALVRWPLSVFIAGFVTSLETIFDSTESMSDIIDQIENLANIARKDSLLGLEKVTIENEFMQMGVQMAVDGRAPEAIDQALVEAIGIAKKKYKISRGVLDDMGEAAPAFGMIGTVVGLIVIMANLADPDKIGPGLAVALITTLYGALAANMYFLPLAKKIKYRGDTVALNMEIMRMGLNAILAGDNPRLIRERLEKFDV